MSVALWAGVAVLGGAGAVLRVLVTHAVATHGRRPVAVGTLVVNLSGAFLLGVLTAHDAGDDLRLLAGTALLGSYTTFSTWMIDVATARTAGRAVALASLSLVSGLALALLGRAVG